VEKDWVGLVRLVRGNSCGRIDEGERRKRVREEGARDRGSRGMIL